MHGWTDGWMHGRTDGRMDGWMDGYSLAPMIIIIVVPTMEIIAISVGSLIVRAFSTSNLSLALTLKGL